jgi:hypothetical protein
VGVGVGIGVGMGVGIAVGVGVGIGVETGVGVGVGVGVGFTAGETVLLECELLDLQEGFNRKRNKSIHTFILILSVQQSA